MGDGEINLIVGEMRTGFKDVRDDIKEIRREHNEQIATVHQRITGLEVKITKISENGDKREKENGEYSRKEQKEFDVGIGRFLHGTFKNYPVGGICQILVVLAIVVTASYMAISKYRSVYPSKNIIEKVK